MFSTRSNDEGRPEGIEIPAPQKIATLPLSNSFTSLETNSEVDFWILFDALLVNDNKCVLISLRTIF